MGQFVHVGSEAYCPAGNTGVQEGSLGLTCLIGYIAMVGKICLGPKSTVVAGGASLEGSLGLKGAEAGMATGRKGSRRLKSTEAGREGCLGLKMAGSPQTDP